MRPGQSHQVAGVISSTVAQAPQHATSSTASRLPIMTRKPALAPQDTIATWDRRLYSGLRVNCVPAEVRAALAEALGNIGVEAEFLLMLVNAFPDPQAPSRQHGEAFLLRLEASAQRIQHAAEALEVATQSYLTALDAGYPTVRAESEHAEIWWQAFSYVGIGGEPLELRLRHCGFAYRHVVATHLASNVEAIVEQMALTLHALNTLPPAGTLPAATLYQSLYELSSTLQGYVIPHHITNTSESMPGIFTSIRYLRALTAQEDTSLASDIAWAQAQYNYAHSMLAAATAPRSSGPANMPALDSRQSALAVVSGWQEVLATLETLTRGTSSPRR
ncbi:MAG: hypothetical protein ACXWP6_04370 [Ktedonobacterales bacterium]